MGHCGMAEWHSERSRNGSIDEVPLPATAGRLWLCGKHFIGADPDAALRRVGADVVVCLNEAEELQRRYPTYVQWLRGSAGSRAIWFPIPDMHVPSADAFAPFLDALLVRLAAGDGVIVTCGAGMGRAGTMAVALLLALGVPLDDALETLDSARPGAGPQTTLQVAFLSGLVEIRS